MIDPPLNRIGARLAGAGVHPDKVTLTGLFLGLLAAGAVALGVFWLALGMVLLSRLADGLDGAVARARGITDFGGYLDIVADFMFYAAIPLAFVWYDPVANGLAGAFLLASFYVNGATFLGFAVLAEKRRMRTDAQGVKSLYYSAGLLEGSETIFFFALICLFPTAFAPLAAIFGALCIFTAISRILLAARLFR
nr:CDP-alcohol phosphatidyltransferase family protein [Pararhodobacter sp. SW119]